MQYALGYPALRIGAELYAGVAYDTSPACIQVYPRCGCASVAVTELTTGIPMIDT